MKASCKLVNRIKGTNITADTVEGLGRIKKIWGTESGLGTDINLFDGKIEQGSWMTDTGELVDSLKRVRSVNYIAVNGNTKYTFSIKDSDIYQILVAQYNSSKGFISSDQTWNNFDYTITTANNAAYIKILIQYKSNTEINVNNVAGIKMQEGTTSTKWSPYNYGILEIVSKNGEQQSSNICYVSSPITKEDILDFSKQQVKRTVTYNANAEELWTMDTSSVFNRKYFYTGTNIAQDVKANSAIENTIFKSRDEVKNFSTENWIALASNGCLCIYLKEATTLEQFKDWLAQNPLTVTYERNVELLDCSNKITQYANSTTVYNIDGAEIEVSLTNNKAISEVNENLDTVETQQEELQNYSTEEQKIGKWINGKTLYRKVITANVTANMITGSQEIASISGIKPIKISFNTVGKTLGIIPNSVWFSNTDYIYCFINDEGSVRVRVSSNVYVGKTIYCILEYTKD